MRGQSLALSLTAHPGTLRQVLPEVPHNRAVTIQPGPAVGAAPTRTFAPLPLGLAWWERIPNATAYLTLATMVLLVGCLAIPAPYAVRLPGPTVDTLGSSGDTPLISIEDEETFPSDGELRLTTVSVMGGPGYPVGVAQVLRGWWDDRITVVPREAVFPPDRTREEVDQQSQAQMVSSQENATIAALEALDYTVGVTLVIAETVPGGPAEAVVEKDDVITSIAVGSGDAVPVGNLEDLTEILQNTDAGTAVRLGVLRDGEPTELEIVTGPRDDGESGSVIGVLIDPEFAFPVQVDIEISNIGGSSAGTMFALGIMELLTPGDATGGHVIAGTGTMDASGQVGPIGGIVQKLNGSARDGAEYFLAPASNCAEVVGNVPNGLQVIKVETLDQAWEAVEAIGSGTAADLPTCE